MKAEINITTNTETNAIATNSSRSQKSKTARSLFYRWALCFESLTIFNPGTWRHISTSLKLLRNYIKLCIHNIITYHNFISWNTHHQPRAGIMFAISITGIDQIMRKNNNNNNNHPLNSETEEKIDSRRKRKRKRNLFKFPLRYIGAAEW